MLYSISKIHPRGKMIQIQVVLYCALRVVRLPQVAHLLDVGKKARFRLRNERVDNMSHLQARQIQDALLTLF